tara:strand:- start:493 stop:2382 length:1890 start_codon:yes stop_codon:yes gene_type:complete
MTKIYLLFITNVFIVSNLFSQVRPNIENLERVVGGIDADIKDYPWQIALVSGNGFGFCGGAVIGDSWVLTAAHCVDNNNPNNTYIRGGSSDPYASGGETYSVSQIIIHPSYGNPNNLSYDFALIEIDGDFNFNENLQIIDIIDPTEVLAGSESAGVISYITGWGSLSSGGPSSSTLQVATAPIVYNSVACGIDVDENGNSGEYPCGNLDTTMICAGDLIDGGEDACQGDSGGPLAVRSSDSTRWLLVGITSWGYGCAQVQYPGVWSRVSYVYEWINENANISSDYGCIDTLACNFDSLAIYDNGLCFEIDECGECGGNGPQIGLDCNGNCLEGTSVNVEVGGGNWENTVSWEIQGFEGGAGVYQLCLNDGCSFFNMFTSFGNGWYGNYVEIINNDTDSLMISGTLTGSASDAIALPINFSGECEVIYGCTDSTAFNFNFVANTDDGGCVGIIYGCSDINALNFDSDANTDDGSCTYPLTCGDLNFYNLLMYDSFGDGWNNNAFSIINSDGQILHNVSLEDGDFGFYQFCLSSGCYDLVMDNSGIYSNEVSWEIIDSDENLILNGLSPSNSVLEVNNFCNLSVDNNNIKEKKIIKILNVLGQVILENNLKSNSIFFEIYDDGSVVKKILN